MVAVSLVPAHITPADIRLALIARRELALLDLREEDVHAQAHPLFAASLPLSRLELEILDRVPRRDTLIVLLDDDGGLTARALPVLADLGYRDVRVLAQDGVQGLEAWRRAGGELFRDVNVPSKAFGELVEAQAHTPSLPAPEAKALIDGGADVVVLDARRFEEYATMSIPTGISVPGAELVLRAGALAPDPATTIIVNCAGRTRSLIGAQSLRNAGVPNPVYALRNGTIGWTLAGFALDHGQGRRFREVDAERAARAQAAARDVAYRAGVRHIGPAELAVLAGDAGRTLYRFDVRTPEEYEAGHLPGFRSAPGGQLVQETEAFAPVRGARIVLFDTLSARADMTASWLAQMGWDALVLDGVPVGSLTQDGPWRATIPALPQGETVSPEQAHGLLAQGGTLLLDLGPSPAYRRGHIPGARFAIRSRLPADLDAALAAGLPRPERILVTAVDERLARLAAADLAAAGWPVLVLTGGAAAWAAQGLPLIGGFDDALSAPEDVYRRPYEGTDNAAAAMQAYLDWEFGLVAQLRRDATHGFFVIPSAFERDRSNAPSDAGRGHPPTQTQAWHPPTGLRRTGGAAAVAADPNGNTF